MKIRLVMRISNIYSLIHKQPQQEQQINKINNNDNIVNHNNIEIPLSNEQLNNNQNNLDEFNMDGEDEEKNEEENINITNNNHINTNSNDDNNMNIETNINNNNNIQNTLYSQRPKKIKQEIDVLDQEIIELRKQLQSMLKRRTKE